MRGPSGFGAQNFVPLGLPMPFAIAFEHDDNALRNLAQVRIVQRMDADTDVRAFQLGDIRLGELFIDLPDARGAFTGEFDFTAQRGFVLQVTAGVDIVDNVATWLLRAVDAETGLLINDPNLGLLKPGETGKVSYRVKANPQSVTGATIEAAARVFFDNGAPLDSNRVVATVDATAPATTFRVLNLGNGAYQIDWEAADDLFGAGVKDHTVFVAIEGGAFFGALRRTTASTYI
jgi:hypothetical protein